MSSQPKPNPVASTVVGLIFIGLVVVGIVFLVHVGSSLNSGGSNPGGQAKYDASVDMSNAMVVNPADLRVFGTVTNTGSAAGTPTCTLQAHDDSYTYTGVDVVKRTSPLEPGGIWNFGDDLTITKQGAQYVTSVDISC